MIVTTLCVDRYRYFGRDKSKKNAKIRRLILIIFLEMTRWKGCRKRRREERELFVCLRES